MKIVTLDNLTNSTEQEVFNHVAKHLLTQMKQSRLPNNGQCAYLSEDGNKCAAGSLISKEEYIARNIAQKNSVDWGTLIYNCVVPSDHRGLIEPLQIIHDCRKPNEWLTELNDLAKKCNLTPFNLEVSN